MILNKQKVFHFVCVLAIFLNLGFFLDLNREAFLINYDVNYWQERFEKSQWARGYEASQLMGDAELYAYTGWRQIQGMNPAEINAEQPPLGKYLIGLSILVFKNQNVISVFLGLGTLMIIFLIAWNIVSNKLLAILPALLFGFDSLFKENLIVSMLDLPLTFFTCLTFLFLLLAGRKKMYFLPAAVGLGLVATTKIHLAGFGLLIALCFFLLFIALVKKDWHYLTFFLFIPFFALTYLGVYLIYFLKGKNFWDFKYLHFWIRHFARVQVSGYPKGEIYRILLFGRWLTWWEGFKEVTVKQWSLFWPLSFLASLLSIVFGFKEKNYSLLLLVVWIFAFLIMYTFGVPYPRYLLVILPALYILLSYMADYLVQLIKVKK